MTEEKKKQNQEVEAPDALRTDFMSVLRGMRNGDCVFELSQDLEKVVEAVGETGKKGSVTLKIDISPNKGDTVALLVEDKITTKIPKKSVLPSIFFRNDQNTLQREDPRQMRLPFND